MTAMPAAICGLLRGIVWNINILLLGNGQLKKIFQFPMDSVRQNQMLVYPSGKIVSPKLASKKLAIGMNLLN